MVHKAVAMLTAILLLAGCAEVAQQPPTNPVSELDLQQPLPAETPPQPKWEVTTFLGVDSNPPQGFWLQDGQQLAFYQSQSMAMTIVDRQGNELAQIPLNAILEESVISFPFVFSPDGQKLATSRGIVDREGKLIGNADYISGGQSLKAQKLRLETLGWLDNDRVFWSNTKGMWSYNPITGETKRLTPDPDPIFSAYDKMYTMYFFMAGSDTYGGVMTHSQRVFYPSFRRAEQGTVVGEIYMWSDATGEKLIAKSDSSDGNVEVLGCDSRHLIYAIGSGVVTIYDYMDDSIVANFTFETRPSRFSCIYQGGDQAYIGYSPGYEQYVVETIGLDGTRQQLAEIDFSAFADQYGWQQTSDCGLLGADQQKIYLQFQFSVLDEQQEMVHWHQAVTEYDIQTAELTLLFSAPLAEIGNPIVASNPAFDAFFCVGVQIEEGQLPAAALIYRS